MEDQTIPDSGEEAEAVKDHTYHQPPISTTLKLVQVYVYRTGVQCTALMYSVLYKCTYYPNGGEEAVAVEDHTSLPYLR